LFDVEESLWVPYHNVTINISEKQAINQIFLKESQTRG
jgi:hypothetical protein